MNDPTIRDDIREAFVHPPSIFAGYGATQRGQLFDAWENRIRAEALREAAAEWLSDPESWGDNDRDCRNELRDRADRIERGSSDA